MINELLNALQGEPMRRMSSQTGVREDALGSLVSAALPLLVGALDRNTNNTRGAKSLARAIERDHDGSVLDDVAGFLGQGPSRDGYGILNHVFGSRQNAVGQNLGRATGVDAGSITQILAMLAPLVLGSLGKQKRQAGYDAKGLSQFLTQEHHAVERRAPGTGNLISQLLDADGDGDVTDDLLGMGGQLLGGLFGKRR